MFETLRMYFQYPFVRYALIVGVLIALCSSLLGVTLVLKRFSFIGDGLSHVAFGAMAIASVLNITNNMLFILPVTVICAILLLRAGQNTRIKGDAAIAMISVGALAIGYLLMNLFSTSPNISGDVCSTLFGSTNGFQYPFVRYALIVGVLIALCSSLLGVTLVLKRFSFIGDGLSHVAFGAMAIASVLNITNNMLFILPVTVICAILLLRAGQNTRIKGDAAIAMISVGALAIGYLLMNLFSTSPNISGDVCSTLFGSTSILTLTKGEVWLCAILSVVVVAIFILFYNKIFAVTFDENFARATGTRANAYNLLIAVVIAVIIVLAMNLVGSLLISALVIFPALSAMRLFKSFRSVTISAAVLSVLSATAGILISILAGTPVGSTIVAVDIAVFLISYGIGRITGR